MKAYTAQEWQTKFKVVSGKDKQMLHDLECTALVKLEEAQKLEADFKLMETETLKQLHKKCTQIAEANKELDERIKHAKERLIFWQNKPDLWQVWSGIKTELERLRVTLNAQEQTKGGEQTE